MKLSISLPQEDVAFLDLLVESEGIPSRSAALQKAVRLLKATQLGTAYEAAWDEWEADSDGELWSSTISDGM